MTTLTLAKLAEIEAAARALLREAREWRNDDGPPYTLNRRIDAALEKDKP